MTMLLVSKIRENRNVQAKKQKTLVWGSMDSVSSNPVNKKVTVTANKNLWQLKILTVQKIGKTVNMYKHSVI